MKGVDTNILIRFLIGDDEQQTKKVYKTFKKAESGKKELFGGEGGRWYKYNLFSVVIGVIT